MSSHRRNTFALFALLAACRGAEWAHATYATDAAIQVTASVQIAPPKITLQWPEKVGAGQVLIYRKPKAANAWGAPVTNLPGNATSFEDPNVAVGGAYEYAVQTSTAVAGYIYAGIQAPLIESRGKLVLLIDDSVADGLAAEIAQLRADLTGDGWLVIPHLVSPSNSVPAVKAVIQADYNADTQNVKAVFLLGHIPVPYSGLLYPDGHEDHQGAWPADVYYADMNGTWTDTIVNSPSGGRVNNVPGDGFFDQTGLPSDVELMIGRVDLHNMPAFALGELELLRQYLNKDHRFRTRQTIAPNRGLIADNIPEYPEGFAQNGWRGFPVFFGAGQITEAAWSSLRNNDYLWAYGDAYGWYTGATELGFTANYASADYQAIFQCMLGSYFGDWDYPDDLLRAPLCTPTYGLAACWVGRPNWFFHHMALGEPIGYSTRVTQNNGGSLYVYAYGTRFVHIALMGDPTLRWQYVAPPSACLARHRIPGASTGTVDVTWASAAESVDGYHVYRATSHLGPFERLTPAVIPDASFSDTNPPAGPAIYMVRAVKLVTSASGSYFDASTGVFGALDGASNVTRYVAIAGSNRWPYTSWADAAATIQTAVDAADSGDTVLVTNGTYRLSSEIRVAKGITVRGVSDGAEAIVDGGGTGRCFVVVHPGAILDGLRIVGGQSTNGAGVYLTGGKVRNCVVTGNHGVWVPISHPRSPGYPGYYAGTGAGIFAAGGTIENCTIVSNAASAGAGLYAQDGAAIINTILYYNTGMNWTNFGAGATYLHCCATPAPGGTGDVIQDPAFLNWTNGDYHLAVGSPCVDAGVRVAGNTRDCGGVPRPLDGDHDGIVALDLGAYERVDALADSDGDGQSDGNEIMADTDPTDPFSRLVITDLHPEGSGVRIGWRGGQRAWQLLERRGALLPSGAWDSVATNTPPTALTGSLLDVGPTNSVIFYRIRAWR